MGAKVIVVGGGIAGLTAAHELIERGFEVHVFERRLEWGGKAASRLEPNRAPEETEALRWQKVAALWAANEKRKQPEASVQPGHGRGQRNETNELVCKEVAKPETNQEEAGQAAREPRKGNRHGTDVQAVPREHGFRFFPSWYRHLPDTMKRIPYRGKRNEYRGESVFDNLVPVDENLLAWARRDPVTVPLRPPLNLRDLDTTATFLKEFAAMGVGPVEALDFVAKLSRVLTADDVGRLELQEQTWWKFVDARNKSQAFQEFTRASTMTMVAAKAEEVNAETIGKLALRTLLQPPGSKDSVLNGPTHQKFIEPWHRYLEARGVQFHAGFELDALVFENDAPKLEAIVAVHTTVYMLIRLKRLLRAIGYEIANLLAEHAEPRGPDVAPKDKKSVQWKNARDSCTSAKALVALVVEVLASPSVASQKRPDLAEALIDSFALLELDMAVLESWRLSKEGCSNWKLPKNPLPVDWKALGRRVGTQFEVPPKDAGDLLQRLVELRGSKAMERERCKLDEYLSNVEAAPAEVHEADYFVLALPVEQLAYFVNRSGTLRARAPELESVVELARHMAWMSGIQFYLKERIDLVPGHVVGMDTPWALTAIEQTQFWKETHLGSAIKAVISVDIGDWTKRGDFVKKPAQNCSRAEVAREVWAQLKRLVNPEERQPKLRDDMLLGFVASSDNREPLVNGVNFNLDDSIVDLYDRRKQDAYERARSVALGRGDTTPTDLGLFLWGQRNSYNLEPILINRVGSRRLRPGVFTSLENLFLAGDFVKTETDLACMEGANEAGRRAVNAILETSGSREARCDIWDFNPLSAAAEELTKFTGLTSASQPLAAATRVATEVASGILGGVLRSFGRARIGMRNQK